MNEGLADNSLQSLEETLIKRETESGGNKNQAIQNKGNESYHENHSVSSHLFKKKALALDTRSLADWSYVQKP